MEMTELVDILQVLNRTYDDFPELEADHPRAEVANSLLKALNNVADYAMIPLLVDLIVIDSYHSASVKFLLKKIAESGLLSSSLPILRSLGCSKQFDWSTIEPVIETLRQQGHRDAIIQITFKMLQHLNFTDHDDAVDFGDIAGYLLNAKNPLSFDTAYALVKTANSARQCIGRLHAARNSPRSTDLLLAMAGDLRAIPSPQPSNSHPIRAWPSGRMSFDEFLLQWPCEIELSVDLDDEAFIDEAYRAIMLRGPKPEEMDQYLRLLQNGEVSKSWIVEDLLASEELRSLERRLRVILGEQMITAPGRSRYKEMPT